VAGPATFPADVTSPRPSTPPRRSPSRVRWCWPPASPADHSVPARPWHTI